MVQTGFPIVDLWQRWKAFHKKKHALSLCNIMELWWVGFFGSCKLSWHAIFSPSRKKFVRELSKLPRKSCAYALELITTVTESIVSWLLSTFLEKTYHVYSHPVNHFRVWWGHLKELATIFNIYCVIFDLKHFLKGKSYFEMRTLPQNLPLVS